jgi:hypothetical protein
MSGWLSGRCLPLRSSDFSWYPSDFLYSICLSYMISVPWNQYIHYGNPLRRSNKDSPIIIVCVVISIVKTRWGLFRRVMTKQKATHSFLFTRPCREWWVAKKKENEEKETNFCLVITFSAQLKKQYNTHLAKVKWNAEQTSI